MSVGLVEMNDFASGTSSRSTKLIHGGLRYLKQGEIGLVREVGSERALLHRSAPHLVEPIPMPPQFIKRHLWLSCQRDRIVSVRLAGRSQTRRTAQDVPARENLDP